MMIDEELTFPSPALATYIKHREMGLVAAGERVSSRYEGPLTDAAKE